MSNEHVSALVADGHPVARIGMRCLLEGNGIEVVAEAAISEEVCRLYKAHHPNVVLMDMRLPGIGTLEAMRRIRRHDAAAKIFALSASDSEALFRNAVGVGAAGYLPKRADPEEIVDAVKRVAAGGKHFDQFLVGGLGGADGKAPRSALWTLTPREFEVFRLLAEGHSVNDVAAVLSISPKTAGVHHTRIMHKLAIRTPVQLVRLACQQGLIVI